jgi:pSer/pThr/pTyr-binding forkhead associated (FHA) protein
MSETETEVLAEVLTADLPNEQNLEFDTEFVDESLVPDDGISFYIMRIALAVIVHADESFFIGRANVKEDPSVPMLNLENLDGLATMSSVSRQHALVSRVEHGYEITDLLSRNGTWIGGLRLQPNKPYPLACGALLRIGQERLLVRYRPF